MMISEMAGLSDHSDGSIMCHKKSGIVSPGAGAAGRSCWRVPGSAKIIPSAAGSTVRSFAIIRICINRRQCSRQRMRLAWRCIIYDEQICATITSNRNASREIMIEQ
jgi:hypothetical protein